MGRSGSCFAQGKHLARGAQGNLAHSTCLVGAGVDGMGAAGTEDNVREAMHGAWAVEDVCGMA